MLPMYFIVSLKVVALVIAQTTRPAETQTITGDGNNGTIHDEICENLKNGDGAKLNVLCVGLTKNKLLLITKDFYVYDVPQNSMDDAINTLYLRSKPIPMSTKYPNLWKNQIFEQIKGSYIFNSFVMIDSSGSSYVCLTTKHIETDQHGVNYNLDDSTCYQGWTFYNSWDEALISTAETGNFYSIRSSNGASQMNKYSVMDSRPINQSPPPPINSRNTWRAICWQNSEQKEIVVREGGCNSPEEPVQWSIFRGFVQNNKFYLFGNADVIIFKSDVYDSGKPTEVTKKEYSSFFACPGKVPPADSASSLWWLILLIILLLILLCILLFCVFWLVRRRRKRKPKRGKSQTGINSGSFPEWLSAGSVRSDGQGVFGFLTKKPNSGSSFGSHKSAAKTNRTRLSNKGFGQLSRKKASKKSISRKSRKKSNKKTGLKRKSSLSRK